MDLTEKVIELIGNNIEKKIEILPGSNLTDDLELDSFGFLMVVTALEDEFKITVSEEDIAGLKTVADIVAKLEKHINNQ